LWGGTVVEMGGKGKTNRATAWGHDSGKVVTEKTKSKKGPHGLQQSL